MSHYVKVKKPPKRLRSRPTVYTPPPEPTEVYDPPPKPTWVQRFGNGLLGLVLWAIYPFDRLGNWVYVVPWLFRTRKKRYQDKLFKGGWDSLAGGLLSKNFVTDHHVLVVGDRTLSLVYVGPREAEVGWSVPREQLSSVELATWKNPDERMAILRFHFEDASWGDVIAEGPGWKQFLKELPAH